MPSPVRRPVLSVLLALLPLAAALAGCIATPSATLTTKSLDASSAPFSGLMAPNAKATLVNADGTKTFQFEGTSTPSVSVVITTVSPSGSASLLQAFDVDSRVGFVELNLTYDGSSGTNVYGWLLDQWGRVECGTGIPTPHDCTAPIPANTTSKVQWHVEVVNGDSSGTLPASAGGLAYKVAVTLHPPSHMTRGDPLAGVDPSIQFRISDTKVGGSEPNVGVLGDGAIFAQEGLNTMLSKDDGITWKDVAPKSTSVASLDPMLYADPYTHTVYVDQLYVGCSILAWSADEGSSWTTNPAACGLPGDDHEKLASGPSPVPSSPLPAVYYSFSSFAQGVYVSHSYDGGATFVASPVVGVGDGRQYDNTGPVYADRTGDVFDPLYMCDNGGYMGIGVSHDYGATFKFVKVSDQKGACADPDPGVSVDTAGVVYMSYWRPDGVYYAFSRDHGDTWSTPVKVSLPGQLSFVHVDGEAGDAGRLAIAYRATSDTTMGPDNADGWAAWYLYVAFIENATSAHPSIRVGMVTPPGHPDQRGQICTGGVSCAGGSRNLLDFIDIAIGPDGRVYTVYVSGCKATGPCEMPADSHGSLAPVGIEVTGPRLYAHKAPWAMNGSASSLLPVLGSP
ncbi:MAG: sialidase family protein [Thermoplasmatota archaeon]